jgi:type II secretory pathway component PulF
VNLEENLAMSDLAQNREAKGRLSAHETARLTEQIASLTRAGRPLGPGLMALAKELPHGRFRFSLIALASALEKGKSLDEAMTEQNDRIPPHLRGLVLGGIRSGRLGDVLGRFSGYVSIGTELGRKLWLSLAYPIMSIFAAVALFIFVNAVVVAQFEKIFRDFGVPLPKVTIAMLMFSHALRDGWEGFVFLAGLAVVLWVGFRLFLSASTRRSLACRVPVVGTVWKYTSWAEFCHLLALLLETDLPLPEALRLTGEGVRNSDLDQACKLMASDVERGQTLAESMQLHSQLPAGLPRLLKWSADQGAVAEILHVAGEMFEARARGQASFAGTVMAVLAVVLVLWGIFTVVGGLMLPMITLISKLSG